MKSNIILVGTVLTTLLLLVATITAQQSNSLNQAPILIQPNKPTITIIKADDWVSGGRPLSPGGTILVPFECMPNDGWPSNRGGCPFVINNGYVDFQVKVTSSSPIKSITCRMDNVQFNCHGPINGDLSQGFVLTLPKIMWSSHTIRNHSFDVFATDSNNNNSNLALFKFNTLNSESAQQYTGNL